ncbi:calcium-binding protein [Sphingopyxis sp.]|uniref:calcium-binding protein n=1 Tax=Sphingopyxis sp. TaxID=1908224 RepID=UPI0035B459F9
MLKQLLIIGAAAISIPALAQETPPAEPSSPPPTEQPDPSTSQPAPAPESTPPAGTAQPAPSGAAATPAQIAQIVDREFATYDADKSNDLNQAEFAAWMKKLRAATEPSIDPESEQVKTWVGQAWTVADADKSGAVSKEELTGFLSRGA